MSWYGILLELSLLGGFHLRLSPGGDVVLTARKPRALLAYLALHPDRPQSREILAALLWGDRGDQRAHNSLSQAVTALRKGLGDAASIHLAIDNDSLMFRSDAAEVDVLNFERLAAVDAAAVDAAAAEAVADLERARDLYRGELLAGLAVRDPAFEEWLGFERERLQSLAVGVLTRLLACYRAQGGSCESMIATARHLLRLDPFQETAHRALIRGYTMQGQLGLALHQYEVCAETLRRELDVEPEAETTRLRDAAIRQRGAVPMPAAVAEKVAPASSEMAAIATRRPVRRWSAIALLVVLVVLVVIGAFRVWPWSPALPERMAYPLPDKPSIVVLPFANLADDSAQAYFVDGLTEDLITDLAKIPALFVISRNSSIAYGNRSVTTRDVAEELGVRYVLEGSVRRAGEQVRINVQLIEALRGDHIWAERFDGALDDVFTLQDRITSRIVEALALRLVPEEALRLGRRGTDDIAAYDAYLLGLASYHRDTPQDNARAAVHFERAIRLDPGYARAHTALAKVHARAVTGEQAYADRLGIHWTEGYLKARRFMARGAEQPDADYHILRSWLALRKHLHGQAIAEAEQALALVPNDAEALEALAEALILAGRPREGIAFARRAMRQNPTRLGYPFYLLGLAEFALGNPRATVEQVRRAMDLAPARQADFAGLLAAAYGELGAIEQARKAFARFGEGLLNRPALAWTVRREAYANPRYHTWQRIDLAGAVLHYPFAEAAVLARLAAGFTAAGATGSVGGHLPLVRENRLSGPEIRALLFGREIVGTGFRLAESNWRQRRDTEGRVEHTGHVLHAGLPERVTGIGRIHDDSLCEQWPAAETGGVEICVAVFRIPEANARLRWGDYVMVTDIGPAPFAVEIE